jgi:hypothetical protein
MSTKVSEAQRPCARAYRPLVLTLTGFRGIQSGLGRETRLDAPEFHNGGFNKTAARKSPTEPSLARLATSNLGASHRKPGELGS